MFLAEYKIFSRAKSGFTLIEIMIGLVLLGLIGTATTTAISQIFDFNGRNTARMIAIKEIENAINQINRDVQQAQVINVNTDDPSGLPLTLSWKDWNNNSFNIEYSEQDGQLIRTENGGTARVFMYNLDLSQTMCQYEMDVVLNRKVFTMQLTSTVTGYRTASETRSINIIPRPAQR